MVMACRLNGSATARSGFYFGDEDMKKTTKYLARRAAHIGVVALAAGMMAAPTFAATDPTDDFASFYDKIIGWLSGALGKTIGAVGLGVGAIQFLRNQYAAAFGFVAVGLLLSLGPSVLNSIMGAII